MRCDEVIRELAAPTDDRDSAALSEHLAKCRSCAAWFNRGVQFDRLWEKTRPAEPSAETWVTVWAGVVSSLESMRPMAVKGMALPSSPVNGFDGKREDSVVASRSSWRPGLRKWRMIGLIGLAQAAAIMLAMTLTWRPFSQTRLPAVVRSDSRSPGALNVSNPSNGVEIEEGRVVLIRFEGTVAQLVDLTPQTSSYRLDLRLRNLESGFVDDMLLMLNEAESLSKPIVAMGE